MKMKSITSQCVMPLVVAGLITAPLSLAAETSSVTTLATAGNQVALTVIEIKGAG